VSALQYPEIVSVLRNESVDAMALVESLTDAEAHAILSDWDLWALPYQHMPKGEWRRWSFRAGRGTGKTHTGARTVSEVARDRKKIRTGEIGIIGRTHADARHTMVEGSSGILAQAPLDFRPVFEPGNGVLRWPNGVKGRLFSADKPEQMRGPNWSFIWADEPDHWPDAEKTWWEVIEPALRIGWARAMLTSTPLPGGLLSELEKLDDTVTTRASTYQNCYLPAAVLAGFLKRFEGTRRGAQELDGEILEDNEAALWQQDNIDQHRITQAQMPEMQRIVVAVDPAVTAHVTSDETGIVVCGEGEDGHGYVWNDRSGIYTPDGWGKAVVGAYARYRADLVVGEVNNGGDLVESNVRGIKADINFKQVRASRGKFTRAEPMAAKYERGEVHHVGHLAKLETQLTQWDPKKKKSPDRLDALVWGLTELFDTDEDPVGPLQAYL
jgi:phage terminase large subunit-like protein